MLLAVGLSSRASRAGSVTEPAAPCPSACLAAHLPGSGLEPEERNGVYQACCHGALGSAPWASWLERARAEGGWKTLAALPDADSRPELDAASPTAPASRKPVSETVSGPASARLARAVCELSSPSISEHEACSRIGPAPVLECDALSSELLVHAERELLASEGPQPSALQRANWAGDAPAARCLRAIEGRLGRSGHDGEEGSARASQRRLDALLAHRIVGLHSVFPLTVQFFSATRDRAPTALPAVAFAYEGMHFYLAQALREQAVLVEARTSNDGAEANPVRWSFRDTSPRSLFFAPEPTGCVHLRLAVPREEDVSLWLDGRRWLVPPRASPATKASGSETWFVPLSVSRQPHDLDVMARTASGPRLLTHQHLEPKDLPAGLECLPLSLDLSEHVRSILLPVELEPACTRAGVSQEHVQGQVLSYLRGALGAGAVRDFRQWQRALSGLQAFRSITENSSQTSGGQRGELSVARQTDGLHAELARQGFSEAFGAYLSCFRDGTQSRWHFTFSAQRVDLSADLQADGGTAGRSMRDVLTVARLTVEGHAQLFEGLRAPLAQLLAQPRASVRRDAPAAPTALRFSSHSADPWVYEPLWADVERTGAARPGAAIEVGVRRLPDADADRVCGGLERLHRLESGKVQFEPSQVPTSFREQTLMAATQAGAPGRYSGRVARGGRYLLSARLVGAGADRDAPAVRPDTALCVEVREPRPNVWIQSSLASAWPGQLPLAVAGSLRQWELRAGLRLGHASWLSWGGQVSMGVTWRTGQLPSSWEVSSAPSEPAEQTAPQFETPTAWEKYSFSAGAHAEAEWRWGRARLWSRLLALPGLLLVALPDDAGDGSQRLRQELLGPGNRGQVYVAGDLSTHLQLGVGTVVAGETEISVFGGLIGAEWIHWIERQSHPSVANADAGLRWEIGLEVSP